MKFSHESYTLNRKEAFLKVNNYLDALKNKNMLSSELIEKREEILSLNYNELLMVQSSKEHWETLMNDPMLKFRRMLCAKLYNLSGADISEELGLTSGAISNLFHKDTLPQMPRPFQLTVMFDHPWQLVNKLKPNKSSYSQSPEYFHDGVTDRVEMKDLGNERAKVKSISGYEIINPDEIFPQESNAISGRWVTTYQEFDYFEFHLNHEPLIDKEIRNGILQYFPLAKHVITTYRPFKAPNKRAMWVIIPKNEKLGSYQGMLHELKEYREYTEYHRLI